MHRSPFAQRGTTLAPGRLPTAYQVDGCTNFDLRTLQRVTEVVGLTGESYTHPPVPRQMCTTCKEQSLLWATRLMDAVPTQVFEQRGNQYCVALGEKEILGDK